MPLSWISRDGKLIIAARGAWLFAQGSVVVLLIIYLKLVGFSLVETGLLIAAGTLGGALYSILAALFADVIGRRRLLVLYIAARGVAGVALATISSFPLLATIFFLTAFSTGGGAGGLQPLAQATLAETAPARRRNDLYAFYNMFAIGGSALGTLAAGLPVLLQNILGMSELGSYKFMMLWYVFFNLVAALFVSLISSKVEASRDGRRWVNPLTLPSRRKIFTLSGLFSIDRFASSLVIQSLVAYWFFDRFGLQLQSLAVLFFSSNIGVVISMWVGAKLANRFGLINTMVLTQLPSSLFMVALPFVPEAWMAISIWLLYSLSHRMASPMRQSYTMAIVGPEERVAMATATGLGGNASMASGPPIATFLYSFAAAAVPFVASGIIQMIGDLLLYLTFRKVKPPEESRRTGKETATSREAANKEL